jgi:gas vesicle protein
MSKISSKYIFFAFGIGAAIGSSIALLYAPQSGTATRKKIRRGAEDAQDYLEDTAGYLKDQAEKLSKEALKIAEKLQTTVNAGVDQASDLVSGAIKSAQKLV